MVKNYKKILSVVLICVFTFLLMVPAHAENLNEEWYELEIVDNDTYFEDVDFGPVVRSRYISTIITRITQVSSDKVAMRVDVNCSTKMSKIEAVMKLQKRINGVWTNVGSVTVSASDVSSMSKTVTASGLSSGAYRTKATVKVTDYSGYSETSTGYSGSIVI
ncbi:MAG: hypothetical protein ACI4GD_08880 [Lachnospiraceae bacterium]